MAFKTQRGGRVSVVTGVIAPAALGVVAVLCGRPAAATVSAFAWGNNFNGQLGNGTTASSDVPVAVAGLTAGITAVAGAGSDSLAVQNGAILAWGANNYGQLGNGTATNSNTPSAVIGLTSGVTAVAGGALQNLAIQNGAAYAWGFNGIGELGNGTYNSSSTPVPVTGLTSGVTAVAAGYSYSLAVQNGAAFAWGVNNYGQLGVGTSDTGGHPTAAAVIGLTSGVTAVAAGYYQSLAVRNGAVYAWGSTTSGVLGIGTTSDMLYSSPVAVPGLTSGVTAVAAGLYHSLALRNGIVFAWGANNDGQLGNGTVPGGSGSPVAVMGIKGTITAIAASEFSCYALAADGSLWDWGDNQDGEVGAGTAGNIYAGPHQVLAPAGYAYLSVSSSANSNHVLATLAHPDAAVGSAATGPVLGRDSGGALVLSSPTFSGSVQINPGVSSPGPSDVVLLKLDNPSQATALVADLNNVYGTGAASAEGGAYQVMLTLPTSVGYFNFDFTTVVGAGPVDPLGTGQSELASVAVDAIAITATPEPASLGLLAAAVGGGLMGRGRRRRAGNRTDAPP